MTDNIDDLKVTTQKLLGLLEDPHPGLATWSELFRRYCADIAVFAIMTHSKTESVRSQAKALLEMGEDGWDTRDVTDLCEEILELTDPSPDEPVCEHEFAKGVQQAEGATSSRTHMVIDVWCKKCGTSGSISFGPDEVNW